MHNEPASSGPTSGARPIRWWPALLALGLTGVAVSVVGLQNHWPYQRRNLTTLILIVVAAVLLWLWWLLFSRARWRWRLLVCGTTVLAAGLTAGLFRIRGVSGDLLPILEPRWASHSAHSPRSSASTTGEGTAQAAATLVLRGPDFPQFLGPNRNGILDGPRLDPDWAARPPEVLWRQPVGAAWSGFAIVGCFALTQEQGGEEELVTCYDVRNGRRLWTQADLAHYRTTIAGEGPRCTPTVVSNRVFTLGATGILNCLDLADGRAIWKREVPKDVHSSIPEWGFAGSPLHLDGKIIVSAGGSDDHSLMAYDAGTGEILWAAGSARVGYSSPVHAVLAGVPQILIFNSRRIAAHVPDTGAVLWEYPWGIGHPHVAVPAAVGTNRVVFSSGYGVGAELLEIVAASDGRLAASRIWKSIRLKAKFANFIARDGFLYGLDDGVLACVDLKDGSQKWKEGRYGHGQMLWSNDLLLLTAENGELILLRPTPEAPNELHRFRTFTAKTWNPPALSGDLLMMRNDQEAACLQLAVVN